MRFEQVVNRVFAMLSDMRLGTVIAVWQDGGVSAHRDLGFRYRVLPSGEREVPVTTFVSFTEVPSVIEIRERIKAAVAGGRLGEPEATH